MRNWHRREVEIPYPGFLVRIPAGPATVLAGWYKVCAVQVPNFQSIFPVNCVSVYPHSGYELTLGLKSPGSPLPSPQEIPMSLRYCRR